MMRSGKVGITVDTLLLVYVISVSCVLSEIDVSGLGGSFQSPGYPAGYEDNQEEVWNIAVPAGYRVGLYFTEFDLELSESCEYDSVQVTVNNEELSRFCGTRNSRAPERPNDIIVWSPSNEMRVTFRSDYSNVERFIGFNAHYYAEDINECSHGDGGCDHFCHNVPGGYYCSCRAEFILDSDQRSCTVECGGVVLNEITGIIETPDYPNNYPRQSNCDWTIDVESGYVINLEFDEFEVEAHPEVTCPYDYVKIEAGSQEFGPYCGIDGTSNLPAKIVSPGHEMKIIFNSDYSAEYGGFRANYYVTAQPCSPLTAPLHGEMTESNFTFKDLVQFSCKPGYFLVGSEARMCTSDGSWTGVQPYCQIVDCGRPEDITNGHVLSNNDNYTYTNAVTYSCNDYYELVGSSVRFCEVDALWSDVKPFCQPICGESTFFPRPKPRVRVLGGRSVNRGSWPWMTYIEIHAPGHDIYDAICGGSLLNEEWIITAAHCVTNAGQNDETFGRVIPTRALNVSLGVHRRSTPDVFVQERSVIEIVRNPDYNVLNYDGDLALLRLDRPITFTDYVRPICLPPTTTITLDDYSYEETEEVPKPPPEDEYGAIIGWGLTANFGRRSDVLLEAYVPLANQTACTLAYLPNEWPITENMLCAGYEQGGRDACRGDSGGPLMFEDEETFRYFVFGTVSWGRPGECAAPDSYGVYARVGNFIPWIKETIKLPR